MIINIEYNDYNGKNGNGNDNKYKVYKCDSDNKYRIYKCDSEASEYNPRSC